LLGAIEKSDAIKRYDAFLQRFEKGTLDVPAFMREASKHAAVKVLHLMETAEEEKVQLAAAQDILDRAGFNKTTKHLHASIFQVDHEASKMELVNMILSSAKKVGVEVEDPRAATLERKEGVEESLPPDVVDIVATELGKDVSGADAPKAIVEAAGLVPAKDEEDDDDAE